jgi:hypothetical protein
MIAELIKLANELDSRGLANEADTIDFLLKNAAVQLTPKELEQLEGEGWTPEAREWYTDVETPSSRAALGLESTEMMAQLGDEQGSELGEGWTKGQGHHSLSNEDFAALLEADQDPLSPFKLTVDRIRQMSHSPPTPEETEILARAKD